MSDTEETAGSEVEDVVEFRCRKCPGKTFTAAEKDSHRQFHKQQKESKRRPGPKSKTRSGRARDPSPGFSEVTLFERIAAQESPPPKRSRRNKEDDPARTPKRKSKKNYDDTITGKWQHGTGA